MFRSLRHLARRLGRQPLVTGSVMMGVALAIALGVAAALATNALAILGLRSTVDALPRSSQNIQMTRAGTPFEAGFRQRVRNQLGDLIIQDHDINYLPQGNARREAPLLQNPMRLRTQSSLLEHVALTGRAPNPQSPSRLRTARPGCADFPVVEAITSDQQLAESGLRLGDRICFDSIIPIKLVGSYTANNIEDSYWHADFRPLRGERVSEGAEAGALVIVLILAPEDLAGLGSLFEGSTHIYRLQTNPTMISLDTLDAIDTRLKNFRAFVNTVQPRPAVLTGLDRAMSTFNERFRLLQSALATLLLGVITLAFVYLIMVGTLAAEQQNSEIAILRSRGGSTRQIMGYQVGQALSMSLPGAVAGVGLGALAVLLLARTSVFQRLRGGALFPWRFTYDNALIVGGIFGLALLGLILAARPALGMSLVTLRQERARPPRRATWQRAQFDALVLLFAGLGWWQLRRYGGALSTLDEPAQFNLLVLGAPILLMIGGAVLFLRLFPFIARALAHSLTRRRGIVPALSAWQLARNPLLYARLVLLLTLTVGLGVYTEVVSSTLDREQLRQALQEVGADVRIGLEPGDDIPALVADYPNAAPALLTRLGADIVRRSDNGVQRVEGTSLLVGVDGPATTTMLAQSGADDPSLLGGLRVIGAGSLPPLGLPIPPNAHTIDVTLKGTGSGFEVVAKFAGLNGVRQVLVGAPVEQWQTFSAEAPLDLQEPVTLQGFIVQPIQGTLASGAPSVFFGGLQARTTGANVVLHDFNTLDDWKAVGVRQRDALASSAPGYWEGSNSIRLTFGRLVAGRWAALRFGITTPLPVYVARQVRGVRLDPGQTLSLRVGEQIVDATVQSRVGRLPGLDDIRETVLLADRTQLAALLSYGLPTTVSPTELRLALPSGANPNAVPRAETKVAALARQAADPLGNGVRVVLLLGFMCAVILSIVGFVTYAALTIRARKIDLSVLNALGLSSRDILVLIGMEQGFVLGSGVIFGVLVGLLLAVSTRPFLAIVTRTSTAAPVLFDWPALLLLIGALVIALGMALALLLVALRTRGLLRSLKLGEAQ